MNFEGGGASLQFTRVNDDLPTFVIDSIGGMTAANTKGEAQLTLFLKVRITIPLA